MPFWLWALKNILDSYCSFGHRIDSWLKANGAHALFPTIEVNNADRQ